MKAFLCVLRPKDEIPDSKGLVVIDRMVFEKLDVLREFNEALVKPGVYRGQYTKQYYGWCFNTGLEAITVPLANELLEGACTCK